VWLRGRMGPVTGGGRKCRGMNNSNLVMGWAEGLT
jgi:hypothetical protein